jgi:hypothetical protein
LIFAISYLPSIAVCIPLIKNLYTASEGFSICLAACGVYSRFRWSSFDNLKLVLHNVIDNESFGLEIDTAPLALPITITGWLKPTRATGFGQPLYCVVEANGLLFSAAVRVSGCVCQFVFYLFAVLSHAYST